VAPKYPEAPLTPPRVGAEPSPQLIEVTVKSAGRSEISRSVKVATMPLYRWVAVALKLNGGSV